MAFTVAVIVNLPHIVQTKAKKAPSDKDITTETRSMVEKPSVAVISHTGVLEKKFIFCKGSNRKHFKTGFEALASCETKQAQDNIVNAARQLENKQFLREYEHIDFVAKEVSYHKICRLRYIVKGAKVQARDEAATNAAKRETAFKRLLLYINSEIFRKESSKKLVDVNKTYTKFLVDEGLMEPNPDPYHILSKIKEPFGSKLLVEQENKKQVHYISFANNTMSNEIRNVALFLRAKILKLHDENITLPNPITLEAILEGQCTNVRAEQLEFYGIMYTGTKDEASERIERYIESAAEDDIYKATSGKLKPSILILLGMGLKSITGSRKVQEVVNHFGHCIGYHTAEEYETQLATKIIEKKQVPPDGLEASEGLSTNSAWDNYDESMYHDTQGIVIQNEVLEISSSKGTQTTSSKNQSSSTTSALLSVKAESKRSLEMPNIELEPVRKKLKISQCSSFIQTMDNPVNYKTCVARDVASTLSCRTNKQTSTSVVWLELHNNKRSFTISKNWIFGKHWITSNTA